MLKVSCYFIFFVFGGGVVGKDRKDEVLVFTSSSGTIILCAVILKFHSSFPLAANLVQMSGLV